MEDCILVAVGTRGEMDATHVFFDKLVAVSVHLKSKEKNCTLFEVFSLHLHTKLPEMTIFASKDLSRAKKLPPMGLDLMITRSRDYYWFKSLMLKLLS